MIARVSLLVLGLGLLPGCRNGDKTTVDPSVPATLSGTFHELSPSNDQRTVLAPSPYNARGLPPLKDEPPPKVAVDPPPLPRPAVAEEVIRTSVSPGPPPPAVLPPLAGSLVPEPKKSRPTPSAKAPIPSKPADPVVLAFACFREGKTEEGREQLKKADPAARDVLAVLLPLAARLEKTCKSGKPGDIAVLLEQFDELAQKLRPRAALILEKMCFCRGIKKFGVYDPLPPEHHFHGAEPGKPGGDPVQLYVELRNFSSIPAGGFRETALAYNLEIRDREGLLVWRQDRRAPVEQSRSPRRDGYLSCHFYVPAGLKAGEYTLSVHVKDLTGLSSNEAAPAHRVARGSLPFRVRHPDYAAGE